MSRAGDRAGDSDLADGAGPHAIGTRAPRKAAGGAIGTRHAAKSSLAGAFRPVAAAAFLIAGAGCTGRHIHVTSTPPGAEVAINGRIVGATPVRVGYSHYGWYEIVLRKEKFKTVVRTCKLSAPFYAWDPISLVADLVPARIVDEFHLHVVLDPLEEADPKAIAARADSAAAGRPIVPGGTEVAVPEYRASAVARREGGMAATGGVVGEKGGDAGDEVRGKGRLGGEEATGKPGREDKTGKPDGGGRQRDIPPHLREPEGIGEKPPEGPGTGAKRPKDEGGSRKTEKEDGTGRKIRRMPGAGDRAPEGAGQDAPPEEIIETVPPRSE
ncbi:MAG: PEGA domain-containing protein [Planctomycetota bacterium]|nr:PEGA domain-containing protein [Planctomycetota bacterium]